jgi:DNA-binding XRE family transcriptional regulator
MEMKNYIEKAEKKAGKQTELANMLGITASYIRMVKAGKKGFPIETCIVLADYINEDRLEVIAASNLVTEKDDRKRKIFESCFEKTNRAASFLIAVIFAAVILITSPNPANASTATISNIYYLYYVK